MKKRYIVFTAFYISMLIMMGYILYDNQKAMNRYYRITGTASWYGKGLLINGSDAKGYLKTRYVSACNYFPRNSLLLVRNLINGREILVHNTDVHECTDIVIDLSEKAFSKISNLKIGLVTVEIIYLGRLTAKNPHLFGSADYDNVKQLMHKAKQRIKKKHLDKK